MAIVLLWISGCASIMSAATSRLANDLSSTMLNSNDPETVREGAPAYLLLIDSLIVGDPENESLLTAASNLNGAFSFLVEDEQRAGILAEKSFEYAQRAACVHDSALCNLSDVNFETFSETILRVSAKRVPTLYTLGVAWVGWIQTHTHDWNAIAQLSRVRLIMEKLIELDENFENGGPHLYMGGLETIFPAAMGGRPEKGRQHFERAITLSEGRYLMTKVIYAEQYARLIFNRDLHDRLLREVLVADPKVEGMTLINLVAQQRARNLLESGSDYF